VYRLLRNCTSYSQKFLTYPVKQEASKHTYKIRFVCEFESFTFLQIHMLEIGVNFRDTYDTAKSVVSVGKPDKCCKITTLQ
jgi:hypothetical protein